VSFTLAFALQLRKKHGETSVRARETSVKARKTSVISTPSAGFELKFPTSERPQTHALDCAANAIGSSVLDK
jgi:hypothetical protein